MPVAVWASSPDVPGVVCADARLTDRSKTSIFSRSVTSTDQLYGQAGWDIGINFQNIADLAGRLAGLNAPRGNRAVQRGEVTKLAIHAHGGPGTIFINGKEKSPQLTADTVETLHSALHNIGLMTPDNAQDPAVILFVGCLAGMGKSGTDLLLALSRVWPNRKVVAFATLGYAPGGQMKRGGEACTEPGMRDTTEVSPGKADELAGRYWGNLKDWPWASETSPRAKVAMNKRIIRGDNL